MLTDFANRVVQRLQTGQLLSKQQATMLAQQAAASPDSVFQLMEDQHLVSNEDMAKAKAEVLNIGYVDLKGVNVPPDVLKTIPMETAENYMMVPFARNEQGIQVAFLNPEDIRADEALDFIAQQQGKHFVQFVASASGIRNVLHQYESLGAEVEEAMASAGESDIILGVGEDKETEEVVKTAPVSKMISVILKHAIEGQASDVHIEPVHHETRVRYRVDGVLHTSLVLPIKVHQALVARIKVLSNLKLDETRLPQDGRFKMKYENRDVEFRVSTLPLLDQEKVVMRILDTSTSLLSLEDLGYTDRNFKRIQIHLKKPHGMVLVTGPTGSGKSTTLYSMLSILNKEGVNIITLEDPVEYNLSGIAQSQMKPEIGLTFASGLRSVLRQDPDIIMVGEIRDQETAELAVHAALTGHMMLSTLHTNDALGAIPRLIDMGIEPFLIASALNVILAQRLVRRICEHCRVLVSLEKNQEQEVLAEIEQMPKRYLPNDVTLFPPFTVYRGKGCTRCEDTGYHGRVAINEVLENTSGLKKVIGEVGEGGIDIEVLKQESRAQGMFTMRQDGLIKVFRGFTTLEEVWNATKE